MRLLGSMEVKDNKLNIGGIDASDLALKYETPLFIMDEELIRDNCRRYLHSFECGTRGNVVAYAGKAFLTKYMCNIVEEMGLYLDVVSGGELYTAHSANFPMERVMFHGNNKTPEEIEMGIKFGVGTFVVDNLYEIELLDEISRKYDVKQRIYLRIAPGIEAHTHDYIKTGQIDSKFGFSPELDMLVEVVKECLEKENIILSGLHCHIGSQIFEIVPYLDAAKIMLNFIKKIKDNTGYTINELDLGGGFGIYYTDGDKPRKIEEYTKAILEEVDNICKELEINVPKLVIEPGRSIVGNAGTTLYTVGSMKAIPGVRKYVSIDGGMSDNIRPSLYDAQYECVAVDNVASDVMEKVTIAGKCCESGDILIENFNMPQLKSGDIVAVLTTGAYGYSMCSNYNKNPKPAVVMVSNGNSRVICRRESFEDLIRNEL